MHKSLSQPQDSPEKPTAHSCPSDDHAAEMNSGSAESIWGQLQNSKKKKKKRPSTEHNSWTWRKRRSPAASFRQSGGAPPWVGSADLGVAKRKKIVLWLCALNQVRLENLFLSNGGLLSFFFNYEKSCSLEFHMVQMCNYILLLVPHFYFNFLF